MSALPLKADIAKRYSDVRYVPIADHHAEKSFVPTERAKAVVNLMPATGRPFNPLFVAASLNRTFLYTIAHTGID